MFNEHAKSFSGDWGGVDRKNNGVVANLGAWVVYCRAVAKILSAAGQAAAYGLGCVGMGCAVQGTGMAASVPIVSKPISTPGSSAGTSVASTLAGDYVGTPMTVPVGTL